ncbi:MAG: MATE family efflux transporter [Gammaproteobacteria bacterium]|nr:MATE family efflux transporter [Gammaproteobacteria bacterium]
MKDRIKNDLLPLLSLTLPLILTGVMQSSLSFFETIFLARISEEVLAAGALVSWLFATLIVILFGIFSAVNVLIAHKHGANDKSSIVLILRDGLLLAVLLTVPTFILFWNISSILLLFGQSPQITALAKLYLHALAWGLFPKFILIILFELVLGLGHSRTIMLVTILSIPIYIFFSYILIFGKFGVPALGIAGAGWGMTFADWIIAFILFILLFFSKEYKFYLRAIFTLSKPSYVWEILHLGVPMGAMYCIEVGFFFVITLIMGTLSVQALAANQITMQYLGSLMSIIFSIAQAVTVRMGHQLGANQIQDAERTAFTGVSLSVIFMLLVAIFYWTIPKILIAVDLDNHLLQYDETIRLATQFLFIAAFFQIFESARIALFGALRALKDTRFTLLTSVISFWLIPLPIGYALAIFFNLGGAGLWWGMVLGASMSILLLNHRFKMRMRHLKAIGK